MVFRFQFEGWLADPDRNTLTREGVAHPIHPSHMRVLIHLAEHAHQPVDKIVLLEKGWQSSSVSEDNLSVAVSHLRRELGDDLEEPRLIRAVADRGYELFAEVTWEEDPASRQWQRFPKLLLAVLFLLALSLKWLDMRIGDEDLSATEIYKIESVAMKPLLFHSENADFVYLADGVTDWIFQEMSRWENPDLIAMTSVRRLGNDQDIQSLAVDAIIDGQLTLADNGLKLNLRLSQGDGKLIWEKAYVGNLDQLLDFSREGLATLQKLLHPEDLNPLKPTPAYQLEPEVFRAYLEACWLRESGSPELAAEILARLTASTPDFARPYLELARTRLLLSRKDSPKFERELPEVKDLLKRAIKLDKKYAEAYLQLGSLQFIHEWNFSAANDNFNKALLYGPNNAAVHFEAARFSVVFGRNETGYKHLDRLKKLDPLAYSKFFVAWVYNMTGRFEESLAELNLLEAENPDDEALTGAYLRTYENMGDDDRAFGEYTKLFRRLAYSEDELIQARLAFEDSKLEGLNKWLIQKFEQGDVGQFEPPLAISRFCAAANEKDWALTWLQRALSSKQMPLLWLNVDPKYDNLRSDPQFLEIQRRIGLDYR